jgi:hypothetical protein
LLHRTTRQLYPVYWQSDSNSPARPRFRIPTAVSLAATADTPEFVLRNFKPYLKLGIPHYSPAMSRWEPVLQATDQLQFPLSWVHQSLQGLLITLNPSFPSDSMPFAGAMGLEDGQFQQAMRQLAGVVVNYPAMESDTYSFNLREAILGARLVAHPEQIFLVEEAIATLLSAIRTPDYPNIQLPQHAGQEVHLHHADWQGETLILHAGATLTELALVNLPGQLQFLSHDDFQFRSLPYAGTGLDQDIVCQLILNPEITGLGGGVDLDLGTALDNVYVNDLIFPSPGEPDLAQRYRLHQRLTSSEAGQTLLDAAQFLKIKLQHQGSFTLKLGETQKTILRQDLASLVILPYVQRLNRELNALLTQTGTPVLAVQQVICSGGTASLGAIARWLRQKLPNATIIQDTYDPPVSAQEFCLPSCSRVAYGLAVLPLHRQVLDLSRQYSDYYLLQELLHIFPNHPVAIAEIMILLEHQGIDTQVCHANILALLDGHLPPGFAPSEPDALWMTAESRANPDYQSVRLAPLFTKQPDQTYRPNRHQWNHLRSYLDTLLTTTHQKLTEPLGLPVF